MTRPVMVKSFRPELEPRAGVIYLCPCGSTHFLIWQIVVHRVPHIQCVRCQGVFCLGSDCSHEEEEDAELRAEMEGRLPPDDKG